VTPMRTYFLKGETQEEIDEWLTALERQISAAGEVRSRSTTMTTTSE